jgi:hypothetical protein
MTNRFVAQKIGMLFVGGLSLVVGCSAPKGDSGGRVATSETTRAERNRSDQMNTADLAAASDEAAQRFVRELSQMVEQDYGGYRVTVVLGDIANRSASMPRTDFELIRQRLRSKLMSSSAVRDEIKFVEKRRRVESINREEYGEGDEDLLDEGNKSDASVRRSNPEYTFYLNVDADAVHRGPTNLFAVTFHLTRASDGEIVFNKYFEVKYGG